MADETGGGANPAFVLKLLQIYKFAKKNVHGINLFTYIKLGCVHILF